MQTDESDRTEVTIEYRATAEDETLSDSFALLLPRDVAKELIHDCAAANTGSLGLGIGWEHPWTVLCETARKVASLILRSEWFVTDIKVTTVRENRPSGLSSDDLVKAEKLKEKPSDKFRKAKAKKIK